MEFISAKCPKCGGELMLPNDRNDAICTYCGSKFFLSDALTRQQNPSLTTLFQLANNGMRGGNYTEAYDYFTRIVEIDPDNSDAWIGKGISAGWLSTLGKPRISEMVSAISQGLEFVSPEKTETYKINLSDLVTNISKSFYVLAYRHMKENLSLGSSIFNEFAFHVQTASDGIFFAMFLNPQNKNAILLGIDSAKILCEGEDFKDYQGHNITVHLSRPNEQMLLERIRGLAVAMKNIDPSYQEPNVKLKKDDCFIATATMGDKSHYYVVLLRNFRDEKLADTTFGKIFVEIYYKVSPPFAKLIAKSEKLRRISLTCVIKPCVKLVEWIFEREHRW